MNKNYKNKCKKIAKIYKMLRYGPQLIEKSMADQMILQRIF